MTTAYIQPSRVNIELIRRPEVLKLTARSKSSLSLDEKNGLFVPPISIGNRAIAYRKVEVEAVVNARIQGKSNEQIKQLVSELINQRYQTA